MSEPNLPQPSLADENLMKMGALYGVDRLEGEIIQAYRDRVMAVIQGPDLSPREAAEKLGRYFRSGSTMADNASD